MQDLEDIGCALLTLFLIIFLPFILPNFSAFGPSLLELFFTDKYNLTFWIFIKYWFFSYLQLILLFLYVVLIGVESSYMLSDKKEDNESILIFLTAMVGPFIAFGFPFVGRISFDFGIFVLTSCIVSIPIFIIIKYFNNLAYLKSIKKDLYIHIIFSVVAVFLFSYLFISFALIGTGDFATDFDPELREIAERFITPRLICEITFISIIISVLIVHLAFLVSKYRFWLLLLLFLSFSSPIIGSHLGKWYENSIEFLSEIFIFVPREMIRFIAYILIYIGGKEILSLIKSKIKLKAKK